MLRMRLPVATFAAALAAALALAACGGEDAKLLPGETAREITANLDTVKQLAGEGDCVGAESAVVQVSEQIEALEGVDPKLKRALEDGAARLEEVIAGCEEASSEAIAPAEIPAEAEEEGEKAPKQRGPKPKEEEAPEEKGSPSLPPQANGEAKGLERGGEPSAQEEPPAEETAPEGSSGGVSPGAPVGEGE